MPNQVLELQMIGGRVLVARKATHPDSGDLPPPVELVRADGEIVEFE